MTSPDGSAWTSQTSSSDNNWVAVTYGNGLFAAVSTYSTVGLVDMSRVMTSGSIASTSSGDDPQTPKSILQQLPMGLEGSCTGIEDAHLAYGTGLSGGWSREWGEWANAHQGGWVCSRTLTYSNAERRWLLAA